MENRALCLSRSHFHLSSVGPCEKKTLQKAKKFFKLSLLSLSKDTLVNFSRENLSNFCQFILVFNCDLRVSHTDHIFFHETVTIQFLHQRRSHSNQARLKSGKAKSTSQFSGFTDIFLGIFGQN